jgi:hypothetical protein
MNKSATSRNQYLTGRFDLNCEQSQQSHHTALPGTCKELQEITKILEPAYKKLSSRIPPLPVFKHFLSPDRSQEIK